MRVIAYTYEADYHCLDCVEQRFGSGPIDGEGFFDQEGNEIHPVFDTDEWYANEVYLGVTGDVQLNCGTCGELIDEVTLGPPMHMSSTLRQQRQAANRAEHNPDL